MSHKKNAKMAAIARTSGLGAIIALGLGTTPALRAVTLNASLLPRVEAATFEVVAAKPAHDPLAYEKPLPLDLVPYQQRTDKYHSIGTAFAIGPNRYVTAGHVLLTGLNSLWGPPELRDDKGRVYAIDNIEKFSLRKDFVVFSLLRPPAHQETLPANTHPALNQAVYAVGNALGTGVVIRDGLYTSDTPEDQSGAWKWMRFSAAASPGNSGGPLLDKGGNVIGVVLMKSPDENLNYALPISEVLNAPSHVAIINQRNASQFPLLDTTHTGSFEAHFKLPRDLADFNATLLRLWRHYQANELKVLLTQQPDKMFPNGPGSNRVLDSTASLDSMPVLLKLDEDGTWVPTSSSDNKFSLANNGYVQFGYPDDIPLFHLRKPDDISAAQLYTQPKTFMDLLLTPGILHRPVGSEQIKITSLGKPLLENTYTDRWQRRWQVMIWPLPFLNVDVIVMALPVPDGYAGTFMFAPAALQYFYLIRFRTVLNFFNVAYDGTLAQWTDYLKQTALLPSALKSVRISTAYAKNFGYTSPRVHFSFTPAVQKITPDSNLTLGFGFLRNHGKVAWDVGDIYLSQDINDDNNWVNIQRHVKPSPNLDSSFKSQWNKIYKRLHPFDGVARNDNDVTEITGVVSSPEEQTSVLYTAFFAREGAQPQKLMKSRLDLLMKFLKVTEYGTDTGAGG